jgi:alpha-1,2-mannosyltransferase
MRSRVLRLLGLAPYPRWVLAGFFVLAVLFGLLVELRSAYLQRRMGDLCVFLRTSWAVRVGLDIYTVTDHNGFHYHYPPLFAILMVPLADPPPGADRSWTLPYPVTVAIWYAFSLLCLFTAVHWLAGALEQTRRQGCRAGARPSQSLEMSPSAGFGEKGSPGHLVTLSPCLSSAWLLRVLPILACLPPIGHTLMRGQVSLLLLLLLCATLAALLRGRSWQAGLWLAGAICLKVIPAFLILYPLSRRDGRCLAGCAMGLVLGLAIIPAAVLGRARTVAYYQEWTHVLLWPALGAGSDQSRAKELLEATATDSQSIQAALHNALYPDLATRPPQPSMAVRCIHWLAGGLLTLLTLLIAGRRQDGPAVAITFGALTVLMLLISPVCHLHYFCLSLPLAMGSLATVWNHETHERPEKGKRIGRVALVAVLILYAIANALPQFPSLQILRDRGLATYAALLLWLTGMIILWKHGRPGGAILSHRPDVADAAA